MESAVTVHKKTLRQYVNIVSELMNKKTNHAKI